MSARAIVLATALLAAATRADEGMWMPQQIPDLAPRLRAYGFERDPGAFADLTGQPMGAIVSLGGCSASFVSPDGLIVTNHHCAVPALQFNSTPERNVYRDGFLARARDQELWNGPGTRVLVTVSAKDVTDAILDRIDPRLSDAARGALIERREKELVAACEKDGLRCTASSFFEGGRRLLIAQLELRDVRLVHAPPLAVGNFGGETDNWMWPRHTGDFAFFRAYVGRHGRPAPHSKANLPYRPAHWLPISTEGVREDDLVMVAGYPGRTARLVTWRRSRETIEWDYPRTVKRNRELLAALATLSKRSKETAIKVTSRVRQLANTLKNRMGVLEGVRRGDLLERKRLREQELLAWIAADPARTARFGGVLERLDALQAEKEKTRERDAVFADLRGDPLRAAPGLLGAARVFWRVASGRPKPDLDRDPDVQERNWERLREALARMERTLDLGADRVFLRQSALEAAALPPDQRIEAIDAAAGLVPGLAAGDAQLRIDAWLDRLYAGARIRDPAFRAGLFGKSTAELEATGDGFLLLAKALAPLEREVRAAALTRAGTLSRLGPVYARAMQEKANAPLAPDANGTLRVTYGTMKGVSPRDGVVYLAQTGLDGVLEKDRPGDPEFDVPQALRDAIRAQQSRRDGPFVDPKLGAVPVDFLSSVDTTGGNSGSAVLDRKGRLVGLLFDGTYDTIASDFLYDPEKTRSIQVDIRYVLWFMSEVSRAKSLLEELGVRPASASGSDATRTLP